MTDVGGWTEEDGRKALCVLLDTMFFAVSALFLNIYISQKLKFVLFIILVKFLQPILSEKHHQSTPIPNPGGLPDLDKAGG